MADPLMNEFQGCADGEATEPWLIGVEFVIRAATLDEAIEHARRELDKQALSWVLVTSEET